ncbi:MAG: ATP-dependent DNA helicase RecG [Bacteroidota bacterium]
MRLIDLPKLNQKRLEALQKSGIESAEDLLNFFPRRYLHRTNLVPLRSIQGQGEEVIAVGRVKRINKVGYGRKQRLEVIIQDHTASIKGVWFRGVRYVQKWFEKGELVAFFGEAKKYGRSISIAHPDVDKLDDEKKLSDLTGIVPIYPSNKDLSKARISSKLLSQWIKEILTSNEPPEYLPAHLLSAYDWPTRPRAYQMMHMPEVPGDYKKAIERFKYEELFLFELSVSKIKQELHERAPGLVMKKTEPLTKTFFNELLPFELTEGQRSALSDIKQDLYSGRQMNRLIQGDVGAGKTVVAIGAMLMAIDNGYQTAFMAPTEILAEQHYRTLVNFLEPLDVMVRLLKGSQKKRLRDDVLSSISGGRCDIVVGTHALIQETVEFNRLGMAVIDEQHRFGVMQRTELLQKGEQPHVLVMSATPIPRSLAMTIYSDLDVSIIKGLPAGRKPVKTAVRSDNKREAVYDFVAENLQEGGQAYVVYPLVEESEAVDLKDATAGFEKLKQRFSNYTVGLLHGQMAAEEKDAVMRAFSKHDIDILVSTTVIEVGVDVPNANIMIIEHAERFGLSQLHQLRGRIGRGSRQSFCILMAGGGLGEEATFRLKTMARTNDGFEIAEADLKLRGPGDFLGTKQSGLPDFRLADIVEDRELLEQAKTDAYALIRRDPELEGAEYEELRRVFLPYYNERAEFYNIA